MDTFIFKYKATETFSRGTYFGFLKALPAGTRKLPSSLDLSSPYHSDLEGALPPQVDQQGQHKIF